jgi:hypothetical protein
MNFFQNIVLSVDQSSLLEGVKSAVTRLIIAGSSFTAYDVTKLLRNDVGTSIMIEHDDVRRYVADIMQELTEVLPIYSVRQATELNSANPPLRYEPVGGGISAVSVGNNEDVVFSPVKEIGWIGKAGVGTLDVVLGDHSYSYQNVPLSIFAKFLDSPSKGRFFNQNIAGKFDRI